RPATSATARSSCRPCRRRSASARASGMNPRFDSPTAGRRARRRQHKETRVKRLTLVLLTLLVLGATAGAVLAQQPAAPPSSAAPAAPASPAPAGTKIDRGGTAWMLSASALVLLMTAPGLALFYGGMARQKNALAKRMQAVIIMAIGSIQWVLRRSCP